MAKRPIRIKYCSPLFGGYGMLWRAYGTDRETGKEFMLSEIIGGVAYPLERDTEKQLRRYCAKEYPQHPIHVVMN